MNLLSRREIKGHKEEVRKLKKDLHKAEKEGRDTTRLKEWIANLEKELVRHTSTRMKGAFTAR